MRLVIKKFLSFWPFMAGMVVIVLLNRAEYVFDPVVKNFTIEQITKVENGLVLSGSLTKVRDCSFVGVIATGSDGVEFGIHYLDRAVHNLSRPVGTQGWGPWRMFMAIAPGTTLVHIDSVHRCHPFWTTQTRLISILVTPDTGLSK
jgi:hypothetical protein